MARVFISYAHGNEEFVNRLSNLLQSGGISTWYDKELMGGDPWRDEIPAQINACEDFIVVLSKHTRCSDWVRFECGYAEALKKNIKPVWIETFPDEMGKCKAVPDFLSRYQIETYEPKRVSTLILQPRMPVYNRSSREYRRPYGTDDLSTYPAA